MKRFAASVGMLMLVAAALAAAVWDGSAVAGVQGDFPADGLYGACNSFPRDTSVTVTNLENGKTITVTITDGVDNPSVFIALSPKAADALSMRSGSATRIRAVALTASQGEVNLPPRLAGESTDPDYNPKVYVEREKAAEAAAPAPAAVPVVVPPVVAPPVVVPPVVAPPVVAPAVVAPAVVAPAVVAPAAVVPAAVVPAAVATTQAGPSVAANSLPVPETSAAVQGPPKAAALALNLPSPNPPSISPSGTSTAKVESVAQAPEIIGGSVPRPKSSESPAPALADPALPAASPPLAQTEPEIVPDQLPEAVLSRIIAPTKVEPVPVLAEAAPPSSPPAASAANAGPEAIALDRPSYAPSIEGAASPVPELAAPVVPTPSESMTAEKPAAAKPEEAIVALEPAQPRPPQAAAPEAPTAPPAAATTTGRRARRASGRRPRRRPIPRHRRRAAAVAPPSIPLINGLEKGSFYIQIGVFATNESLRSAIAGFKSTYPLAVEPLTTSSGVSAFRLYVGPLGKDESGVVLIGIRYLGYRDAYIRQGS